MKKSILLVWAILLSSFSFAQTRNLNLREFNTWSVQANAAINYGNTDIAKNNLFYTGVSSNVGYGLRVNKFISHNLAFSLDGYRSTLHGSNLYRSYKTSIDYQVSIMGQIQTGNIRFINQFNKMQLYGFIGYGTIRTSTELTDTKGTVRTKKIEQVIPVGMGVKYHISNKLTLNLEYAFNRVNGDYLDGYSNSLTEYDNYSKFAIGASYTFGSDQNRILEWHDPRPRQTTPFYRKDTVIVIQRIIEKDTTVPLPSTQVDSAALAHVSDSLAKDALTAVIYYDFNKWNYPLMYNSFLSDIAVNIINNPGRKITIDSYCDTIGTPEHNLIIVERRAKTIAKVFTDFGIPRSLIEITLHGEESATAIIDADNRKSIVSVRWQ